MAIHLDRGSGSSHKGLWPRIPPVPAPVNDESLKGAGIEESLLV